MAYIQNLKLHFFRSYDRAEISDLHPGMMIFYGSNGAGKTNILEAVSLLAPGRGLRGARAADLQKSCTSHPWAVSAGLKTKYEDIQIGTGIDPANNTKRTIRINGQAVKNQSVLAKYLSCVWLTPQMDRLFIDSSRERRRFLDRLVFGFDPGHSGRVTRYENVLAQRSKLLREGNSDPLWLSALEQQIAETGVAIAAARLDFTQRLQIACNNADHSHFPLASLSVSGTLEEMLLRQKALEVEERFKEMLLSSRERDSIIGGSEFGAHKSDLTVKYADKNMPASQCSTGEQKALLTGLILAHAQLIKAEKGQPPLILLDEVAAHLDENRRYALYEMLESLQAQVWLTGTDKTLFEAIGGHCRYYEVLNSKINIVDSSGS